MLRISLRAGLALLIALGAASCRDVTDETRAPTEPLLARAAIGPSPLDPAGPEVGLQLIAEDFTHPVTLTEAPDGSGRLFVVDQTGQIWIITADGTRLSDPFLDVSDRMVELMPSFDERGLLGLAFHPDYATNGRFFVYYTAPPRLEDYNNTSTVSEFRVSADPNLADPTSEQIIIQEDQPQFNHDGGTITFGPDGFLYIGWGDGGGRDDEGAGPPQNTPVFGHVDDWYEDNAGGNGQDIEQNLLGNILRIDVDGGEPYAVPPDNPFVGTDALAEIYAYGFRNPYRFSFDIGGDHDLFVGDAGQNLWEEVSVVEKGGNYGWNVKEGTHCFDAEEPFTIPEECPGIDPTTGTPLTDPVIEFANLDNPFVAGVGNVVVGGYVYRGALVPELEGQYVFGTFSTVSGTPAGAVFVSTPSASDLWPMARVQFPEHSPDGNLGHFVLGFGQDSQGEVYVLTTDEQGPTGNTGKVYRLASLAAAEECGGFCFLPPTPTITETPSPSGPFDGSLNPTVLVCEAVNGGCGLYIAGFLRSPIVAPTARITVDEAAEEYQATWNTSRVSIDRAQTYRIIVFADGRQLGSLKVSGSMLSGIVPIRFRIEGEDGGAAEEFVANLLPLNGSGVSGTARFTVSGGTFTAEVEATGHVPDVTHLQHIHGFSVPAASDATCPDLSADTDDDGIISIGEGAPFYGPVLIPLDDDLSAPPGTYPMADAAGTINYAESTGLPLETTEGPADAPSLDLTERAVVLHGGIVDGEFNVALPVACGVIKLD